MQAAQSGRNQKSKQKGEKSMFKQYKFDRTIQYDCRKSDGREKGFFAGILLNLKCAFANGYRPSRQRAVSSIRKSGYMQVCQRGMECENLNVRMSFSRFIELSISLTASMWLLKNARASPMFKV